MKSKMFKWLPILLMAALCVGFASCGDDDETDSATAGSNLIGTWYDVESNSKSWLEITFSTDGKWSQNSEDGIAGGTYKVEGNVLQMYEYGELVEIVNFSVSDNTLVITMLDGEVQTFMRGTYSGK